MIKFVKDKNMLGTKARIIVQFVSDDGDIGNNGLDEINADYKHIIKEYFKYIKYCQKNNINIAGNVIYIPLDVWALGLVDTFKNEHLNIYDKDFKYIVCAFCKTKSGKKYQINNKDLKECLRDIFNKAQSIGADVAMTHSDIVEKIVREMLNEKSTVNVYFYNEN